MDGEKSMDISSNGRELYLTFGGSDHFFFFWMHMQEQAKNRKIPNKETPSGGREKNEGAERK